MIVLHMALIQQSSEIKALRITFSPLFRPQETIRARGRNSCLPYQVRPHLPDPTLTAAGIWYPILLDGEKKMKIWTAGRKGRSILNDIDINIYNRIHKDGKMININTLFILTNLNRP